MVAMKISFRTSVLIILTTLVLVSCGTTGSGVLYNERSINPTDVRFKRVAVLPNRLPLNLSEPEKWKKFNWEVMKKRLEREGLLVIDYETSVDMFNKSGLPLEDTKVSRDKYAELAEELDADILVFPYYGTSFRITGITDKNNFEVTGSLQVYLADQNDFMTRIDVNGNNYFHAFSKLTPVFSILVTAIFSLTGEPELMTVGAIVGPAASIGFLIPSLTPARKRWERAFRYSLNKGLDQFFAKYNMRSASPATSSSSTTRPQENTYAVPVSNQAVKTEEKVVPPNTREQPALSPATKPLSSYSVIELEKMKQEAVNAKDFRKAQAIKEEIEKRTK
jgi:hypothetical protein